MTMAEDWPAAFRQRVAAHRRREIATTARPAKSGPALELHPSRSRRWWEARRPVILAAVVLAGCVIFALGAALALIG